MFMPFMEALPEVGSSSVAKMRTRVVFPAPFLPINAKIPVVFKVSVTLSRAL
jgi:hypothetical protein